MYTDYQRIRPFDSSSRGIPFLSAATTPPTRKQDQKIKEPARKQGRTRAYIRRSMGAVAEAALLVSAFPDDLVFLDEQSRRAVEQYLEDATLQGESEVMDLSFTIILSHGCSIKVVLPTSYPETHPIISLVDVDGRENYNAINTELNLYLQSTDQGGKSS